MIHSRKQFALAWICGLLLHTYSVPVLATDRVVRLRMMEGLNGKTNAIVVEPAEGGIPFRLYPTPMLVPTLDAFFKVESHHYFTVTYQEVKPKPQLTAIAPYKATEELDGPNAWIFNGLTPVKNAAGREQTVVNLSKFEVKRTAVVPLTMLQGRPVSDPTLMERLGKFSPGDVIEVELQSTGTNPVLLGVDDYRKPRRGDFVSVERVKVEGKPGLYISVTVKGMLRSFALPVAGAASPPSVAATLSVVQALKPGDQVVFTARRLADGEPETLREIFWDVVPQREVDGSVKVLTPYLELTAGSNSARLRYRDVESAILDSNFSGIGRYPERGASIGIGPDLAAKMLALWSEGGPRTYAFSPKQQNALANAGKAWLDARDDVTRERAKQRMCMMVAELSKTVRPEMERRLEAYKNLLTNDQFLAVMSLRWPR